MSRGYDPFERATRNLIDQTRLFFEPHLVDLRLSRSAIMEQDLEQLQQSLATLDTLISHPEQFGLFRFKFSGEAGIVIPKDRAEAQL